MRSPDRLAAMTVEQVATSKSIVIAIIRILITLLSCWFKAGWATRDPCQHCQCFALWTWRPVKRAHYAVSLCIRRSAILLSHRVDARDGPVMEPSMLSRLPGLLVNTAHFANDSRIQIGDNLPSNTEGPSRVGLRDPPNLDRHAKSLASAMIRS
jgi:hypothetical protein